MREQAPTFPPLPRQSASSGSNGRHPARMRFLSIACLLPLLVLACLLPARGAQAQHHRLIPVDDPAYGYLQRLQRRGHLLDLNPTALPYRQGDVLAALAALDDATLGDLEQQWVALLRASLAPVPAGDDDVAVGLQLEAGVRAANQERLDVLRPLESGANAWSRAALRTFAEHRWWIAELGLQHDLYYEQDPDGLDATRRLATRSEHAYLGASGQPASLYLGRFSNQWGLAEAPAALIGTNPRSYDQLNLRLGGPRLAIRSLVGELDSITEDGQFTGRAVDDTVLVGSKRRYLAAHRLDWRPSRHVTISLMEAVLYSGANSGFSLKYLNPLHFFSFVVDNSPKNDENNGFLGGLLWLYFNRLTLHGQLLIDDVDLLGQGREPASVTVIGTVHYAGLWHNADAGVLFELVSARAYNTQLPEGKYLYLLRGLATQYSDYIHTSLFADVYLDGAAAGLRLTPRLHYLAQGARDIRQPFPEIGEPVGFILDGVVEHTVRAAVQLYYQPRPAWWIRVDAGVNVTQNAEHVPDARRTRFIGELEVGARVRLGEAFALPF
jgi:hypothetical protein